MGTFILYELYCLIVSKTYYYVPMITNLYVEINFKYITENVPRKSSIRIVDEIEDCSSCACVGDCSAVSCDCQRNSEFGIWRDDGKIDIKVLEELELPIIYECNDMCRCDIAKCTNRNIQKGLRQRLEVFRTERAEWGLRSAQMIPAGDFVTEFIGEIIKFDSEKTQISDFLFKLYEIGEEVYCLAMVENSKNRSQEFFKQKISRIEVKKFILLVHKYLKESKNTLRSHWQKFLKQLFF